MIIGMGTDIIDKVRINKAYSQHGDKFINKLLSEAERVVLQTKKYPIDYLAKRWAAKEALGKAIGCGIRAPVLLPNISVLNDELGKPFFQVSPELDNFLQVANINKLHLSISDEKNFAIAWVICEHLP